MFSSVRNSKKHFALFNLSSNSVKDSCPHFIDRGSTQHVYTWSSV